MCYQLGGSLSLLSLQHNNNLKQRGSRGSRRFNVIQGRRTAPSGQGPGGDAHASGSGARHVVGQNQGSASVTEMSCVCLPKEGQITALLGD